MHNARTLSFSAIIDRVGKGNEREREGRSREATNLAKVRVRKENETIIWSSEYGLMVDA